MSVPEMWPAQREAVSFCLERDVYAGEQLSILENNEYKVTIERK